MKIPSPYPPHPKEEVRAFLRRTNPEANIDGLSDDALIDLYLRRDQGRDLTMRDHFGFDPDRYIPGSARDKLMEGFTRYYIRKFMEVILADPCATSCSDDIDAIKELLVSN